MLIRPLTPSGVDAFLVYLNDHLRDNGRDGAPLFQPIPPGQGFPPQKAEAFRNGVMATLEQPNWRRVWIAQQPPQKNQPQDLPQPQPQALDAASILGHIDLRARPEAAARHRALLGMGVQRVARRAGLGMQLLDTALAWAGEQGMAWVDLEVLSGNAPAIALYRKRGFQPTGEIPDMFRIDGRSYGYSYMSFLLQARQGIPV